MVFPAVASDLGGPQGTGCPYVVAVHLRYIEEVTECVQTELMLQLMYKPAKCTSDIICILQCCHMPSRTRHYQSTELEVGHR